jgi:GDP-L-fucose synthase
MSALLHKCQEAKAAGVPEVTVWGTGQPRRKFLHVDDLADAAAYLIQPEAVEEF